MTLLKPLISAVSCTLALQALRGVAGNPGAQQAANAQTPSPGLKPQGSLKLPLSNSFWHYFGNYGESNGSDPENTTTTSDEVIEGFVTESFRGEESIASSETDELKWEDVYYPKNAPFKTAIETKDYNMTMTAAILSYCSYNKMYVSDECKTLLQTLRVTPISDVESDDSTKVAGLIAVDEANTKIYIAFGLSGEHPSEDAQDIKASFVAANLAGPLMDPIHVNSAYKERMLRHYPSMTYAYSLLDESHRRDFDIVFCGHSIGASVAMLASYLLYSEFGYEEFGGAKNVINQFKWVTFGMPRTVTYGARFFGRNENHLRYMCKDDFVTHMYNDVFEHTGIIIMPNVEDMIAAYSVATSPRTRNAPIVNLFSGKVPTTGELQEYEASGLARVTELDDMQLDDIGHLMRNQLYIEAHSIFGYVYLCIESLIEAQTLYLDVHGRFIGNYSAMLN